MIVALSVLWFVDGSEAAQLRLVEHGATASRLGEIHARLETALTAPLLRSRGMMAQIVAHGDVSPAEFERVAAVLMAGHRNVRNITVSRGTTIAMVYPVAGNEAALGVDYRDQPHQWPVIARAIASRTEVLQGPVALVQGGSALIGRAPVFLSPKAGTEPRFFGLVSVVVDIPGVFADSGLADEALPIAVAIRGTDGLGAAGGMIYGDEAVFAARPVEMDVRLPAGTWRLAALPKGGWSADGAPLLRWVGALLVLLVAAIAFGTAYHHVRRHAAERDLRRSQGQLRLFREVMDQSSDGIFLIDPADGRFRDVNRTACRRLGYSRDELLALGVTDIDPGLPETAAWRAHLETLRADGTAMMTQRHRRKDGTTFPVEISACSVTIDGAALRLAMARDVTEREDARAASEHMYRQMFLSNLAVKLLVDPRRGAIVDANAAAARFYGYPLDVLKTMRITDINILPPDEVRAEMRAAMDSDRSFFRFRHRLASAEVRDVEVYSGPIEVGGQGLLHSIVIDVTDRIRAEAALKRSNEDLETFAVVASHDLQEPLRMIVSYLQLLQKRYGGRLDAEADEFIGFAVDGAHRMGSLIHGLLAYSRVDRKGNPFAPLSCAEVVGSALANLRAVIEDSGARICVGELPEIEGDAMQLAQLFQNLLGNAIKYRRPGVAPTVFIDAAPDGGGWQFSIRDDGIGIAAEHRERIFVIFQRLHNRSQYEGSGIGLAVCKKIVERHGGRIWVDSTPGDGSTFRFTIPARESPTAA
ncbi:MAG: PAS domain S-box protein [Magnetospirillum sp.]|nr:PAS domain S-box protein [Magnetospirillum sp.]